jgi:hypothetical protein
MTYEKTIETIKIFLDSPEANQVFGSNIKKFAAITQKVEEDIEKAKTTTEVFLAESEQIEKIKESINLLNSYLLEIPITSGVKGFTIAYTVLLINWTNNFAAQEKTLITNLYFAQRFVQYHFTCVEILELLPDIMRRFQSMQSMSIPSVELARHYLGTLDKIQEG